MEEKVAAILADEEANSQLEHLCRLDFESPAQHRRLTGIVCTISRTRSLDVLEKMVLAGMNIVRLNFSHDSQQHHAETVQLLRKVSEKCTQESGYNRHVALAIDLKGPEIRTGGFEGTLKQEVELREDDMFRLSVNKDLMDKGTREVVYVDYPNIINVVQAGMRVYLSDGQITLLVKEVAVDCLLCQVELGGILGTRKSVKLPGVPVDLPSVSERDAFDLKFALDQKLDMVFVAAPKAASVLDVRSVLGERGKDIKVVAKLDSLQSLDNLDDIVDVADGILLDRGDIGVELPSEKVFLVQKAIVARCNKVGRPVICATQILESMSTRTRPQRSDVVDLGNAVLDGADCVMLSSETAIGNYPVEATITMAKVCREAEGAVWHRNIFHDLLARNPAILDAAHAVAISAVQAAGKCHAAAIVVLTTSGRSAHLVSRYRPSCPIVAVTRCSRTARQSHLYRGIIPLFYNETANKDWVTDVDARLQFAMHMAKRMGFVKMGDAIVVVSPWKDGTGFTNNFRIAYAFFEKESFECQLKQDLKAQPGGRPPMAK